MKLIWQHFQSLRTPISPGVQQCRSWTGPHGVRWPQAAPLCVWKSTSSPCNQHLPRREGSYQQFSERMDTSFWLLNDILKPDVASHRPTLTKGHLPDSDQSVLRCPGFRSTLISDCHQGKAVTRYLSIRSTTGYPPTPKAS